MLRKLNVTYHVKFFEELKWEIRTKGPHIFWSGALK
jgi:hypothetical protein